MASAPQVAFDRSTPMEHQEQKQVLVPTPSFSYYGAHELAPSSPQLPSEGQPLEQEPSKQSSSSTLLGLRRRNFWILFAVVLVLIAATIGGSIGGSLALQKKSSSSSNPLSQSSATPQPSTTRTSALSSASSASSTSVSATPTSSPLIPDPSTVLKIDVKCPSALRDYNKSAYTCEDDKTILRENANAGDLTGLVGYSLQQCIDACGTYNQIAGKTMCKSVVLISTMSDAYATNRGANCWLKKKAEGAVGQAGYSLATLVA